MEGGVADQNGNGGTGTVDVAGAGLVQFTGANTYLGGTDISGDLVAGADGALGAGAVTLEAGGTLVIASGVTLGNTIDGFGADTTIDAAGIAGATPTLVGNTLTIGNGTTAVTLTLAGALLSNYGLIPSSDGAGGTDVTYVAGIPPEARQPGLRRDGEFRHRPRRRSRFGPDPDQQFAGARRR